ncbi:hypothetical protein [Actinoplanes sp. NBRC 103695]|uniref:hypothetical protein n=1 Tax=Actinoplanes sp. NBRC 103695 TaxID=3032202 RepID=UPI002555C2EC|nr:hypothetical protein [Actinoplanes sp. NBRC 103695]
MSYQHPIWKDADHPPVPVAADTVEATYVCDFCTDPKILFVYATTQRILIQVDTAHGAVVRDYGRRWSACVGCAALVEARNLAGLLDRILTHGMAFAAEVVAHLADMLRQVLTRLRPGRALTADGQWDALPLPATTLPKVRDRLAALIAGEIRLPFGLSHDPVRTSLAAGLAYSRLYWIDNQFTVLTRNAARVLPRMGFVPGDLPAAHGFVAWAQPVDARRRCVAASWNSHGDAVQLVGYRSIGDGLAPGPLQQLRGEVGWLIPAFAVTLRPGQPVTATHPAAALLTTWRLIRQRLAETTPAKVDRSISRAYRRTRRPEPEVALLRIRGTRSTSISTRHASTSGGTEHEYRWWVTPHWRHQWVGQGRALRDWIVVRPHLRGPRDKPIRATTTVRVLGALPPRPDAPGQASADGQ